MDFEEKLHYRNKLNTVFRPGTPIDKYELFAGRQEQVLDVHSAVTQIGRHVVLFGERGFAYKATD